LERSFEIDFEIAIAIAIDLRLLSNVFRFQIWLERSDGVDFFKLAIAIAIAIDLRL
jgi:hypothetical protein